MEANLPGRKTSVLADLRTRERRHRAALQGLWWSNVANMAIPEALQPWHDKMVNSGLKPRTISNRINQVHLIMRHNKVQHPEDITQVHLMRYFRDRKLEPASILKYLEHVRMWAESEGLPDPGADILKPKAPEYEPRPLQPEVYARLMVHLKAGDPVLYRWARLGGELGWRAFEVAKLEGADLDLATRKIKVIGKGGRKAHVSAPADLFDDLWSLAKANPGPLWPGTKSHAVSRAFSLAAAQIGIGAGFHQMRHSAITAFYRKTRDLRRTQRFARHRKPETTAIYALASTEGEQDILDTLHAADSGGSDTAALLKVLRAAGLSVADLIRLIGGTAPPPEEDDL